MKDLFDIRGKVVVLTGGYGILGRCIAHYLVEQGARVVVLGRSEEQGRELENKLKKKGEALFLVSDVLNKELLEQNRDVEEGKIPREEMPFIRQMVEDISYYNAKRYFGF